MVSIGGKPGAHPWFDATHAPVYGFRFPERMENADLERYCNWFSGWYSLQTGPIGMICDMSRTLIVSPAQRGLWTNFERRSEADLRRVLRGVAIVLTSRVVRGVVTATYWMNRPVYDWEIVATWTRGREWLEPRLR